MSQSTADLERIRKAIAGKINKNSDPHEFRPAKAKDEHEIKYRFYVLPPLMAGDVCFSGKASKDMEVFFIQEGKHWVDRRPYGCPRIQNNEECDMCTTGFTLMDEIPKDDKNKKDREVVRRRWLSTTTYKVNIYFPPIDPNPPELRGLVKYINAPKTCFDHWWEAIQRDASGSTDDPEAYGVFYDTNAAFLYQMTVTKKGDHNNYERSKFLVGAGRLPIAMTSDRKPDEAAIKKIMASRHDLWLRVEDANPQTINKLTKRLLSGEVESGDDEIQATTSNDDADAAAALSGAPTAAAMPATKHNEPLAAEVAVETAPPKKATAPSKTTAHTKAVETKTAPPAVAVDQDEDADINSILAQLKSSGD